MNRELAAARPAARPAAAAASRSRVRRPGPPAWTAAFAGRLSARPRSAGPAQLAGCFSWTVTERTVGGQGTVPVCSSTVPALADAMLPTNAGS